MKAEPLAGAVHWKEKVAVLPEPLGVVCVILVGLPVKASFWQFEVTMFPNVPASAAALGLFESRISKSNPNLG